MPRATHAQLGHLWAAVKDALLDRLQGPKPPSGELLLVARKYLRDNGQLGAPDEESRKQLDTLQRVYLQQLLAAMQQPRPSPALLSEARQFLAWAGRSPDLGAPAAARTAEELLALDVPFRITQ